MVAWLTALANSHGARSQPWMRQDHMWRKTRETKIYLIYMFIIQWANLRDKQCQRASEGRSGMHRGPKLHPAICVKIRWGKTPIKQSLRHGFKYHITLTWENPPKTILEAGVPFETSFSIIECTIANTYFMCLTISLIVITLKLFLWIYWNVVDISPADDLSSATLLVYESYMLNLQKTHLVVIKTWLCP